MGQQQLLLIILGVIVVSVAVIVGIGVYQDHAVDRDRAAILVDLKILSSKAQAYYNRPMSLGGGSRSYVGLTADARGIGLLAGQNFIDNANGSYSIAVAGTATQVVLRGKGKVALPDGSFPEYDLTVTLNSQSVVKVN
ncbi:MAG TPA: hypothetical protein VMG34_10900 [Bacteroidota bacterium]|nr:hypothetical protein [Bacteroidota bacterium]